MHGGSRECSGGKMPRLGETPSRERIARQADVFAFLFEQLGMKAEAGQ